MEHLDAVAMLKHQQFNPVSGSLWADLGCGDGVFTKALAELLPQSSKIFAVDTSKSGLKSIPEEINQVSIEKINADFTKGLNLNNLDGALLANSFHFIQQKESLLRIMKEWLKPVHKILLVEYDTVNANRWVPFPLDLKGWKTLFESAGYDPVLQINTRPSVYQGRMISLLASYNSLK